MFCSWLDLPINDKRNEGCPDCVLSDQAARNEKLLVQLHVRTPSPSSLSSDHRCCPNKWVFHPKMVRLRVQWWSIGMGLRSCFSRRRPDFSMALHRPNRPKLVGFQEWKMAIFFHEKRGYKKHKKKHFMDFLVMALFDHGMCPNWMLEWTQPMVDCRLWSVPKVDLRNFLGPHPPLVPDELWGSARLPEAIDANFTEILVFDLEGNKRYRPHPFKDLVNVTVLRRFDSGMIFFWHVPECSPFLENRTDKEVVTQYILVLNNLI